MRRFVIVIVCVIGLAIVPASLSLGSGGGRTQAGAASRRGRPAQPPQQTVGVPPGAAGASQYVRSVSAVTPPTAEPTLPFTGEDVLLVVLVGLILAGTGVTLYYRLSQR